MNNLDLIICNKVLEIFELAAIKKYLPINFTKKWLKSKVSDAIYKRDAELIDADNKKVLEELEMEYGEELYKSQMKEPIDYSDIMAWIGYIFSRMVLIEEIPSEVLLKHYDIERIMGNYDVLHLFSSTRAIEEIKSEYIQKY